MPVHPSTRVLVLNNDFTPINAVSWKRGFKKTLTTTQCEHCDGKGRSLNLVCSFCLGKGEVPPSRVVEYYDVWIRDSMHREYPVPAVIINTHHIKHHFRKVNFSKLNVFKRDNFTCQYCGKHVGNDELTLDHVVPRSIWKGPGTTTCWHNVVTCCIKCNRKKNDQTPEQAGMPLQRKHNGQLITYKKPKQANSTEMILGLTTKAIPEEWMQWVAPIMSSTKLRVP